MNAHDQPWTRVLSGIMRAVRLGRMPAGIEEHRDQLIFPGSFNPMHQGHRGMAELVSQWYGRPVEFELSVANVDKPRLEAQDVEQRVAQFDDEQILWITAAPTFRDKVRLFPGASFVVGFDTLQRLIDPKYYATGEEGLAKTVELIVRRNCRFVAFGRVVDGVFREAADLKLPPEIGMRTRFVAADEFRMDVSSTELRRD